MVRFPSPCALLKVLTMESIVALGDSIASEGKGDYLYVEGRVLNTAGKPVPGAIIETWETDANGASNLLHFLLGHKVLWMYYHFLRIL